MTVLVLARNLDPQADRVVEALGERGVPVFRTDLVAFPQALTLNARLGTEGWDGTLATDHREVRLSEIRSVWYRHPSHFEMPEGMSGPERRHAVAEARCGLAGVLSSLDVLWVNYPARESDALKPRQLQVARRCGLQVPDSLVTNRSDSVREFATSVGSALAGKTLAAALLVESGRLQMAYTRRIEPAELDDLAGINTTLHFFQPFLPKLFEVRVTVVGDKVFGAAIHAGSDAADHLGAGRTAREGGDGVSFPTDLSSAELELAQARLSELAEGFTANGTLRTPRWREVFTRTWRHPYVPSYYPELGAPCLLCIDP